MNNKGMASLESIALITVFSTLIAYALGMFMVVHSAILNSIAARTYAWETFSHRTNLTFFRDNRTGRLVREHTKDLGFRSHAIISEQSKKEGEPSFWATERYISSMEPAELTGRNPNSHAALGALSANRERNGVNPIWLRTSYGICLNAKCGD
jgi:hypothetical protein